MADQVEWFVVRDVVARLGENCLVTWEGTDGDGIAFAPSWIHKNQLMTKDYHNAITRKKGWFTMWPCYCTWCVLGGGGQSGALNTFGQAEQHSKACRVHGHRLRGLLSGFEWF